MVQVTYRTARRQPPGSNPPPLLVKSPVHTARLGLWRRMFPAAKFIYVHRHPVEVRGLRKETVQGDREAWKRWALHVKRRWVDKTPGGGESVVRGPWVLRQCSKGFRASSHGTRSLAVYLLGIG